MRKTIHFGNDRGKNRPDRSGRYRTRGLRYLWLAFALPIWAFSQAMMTGNGGLSGNAYAGGSDPSVAAIEPNAVNPICFAAYGGNDSADGLSWGTAKQSIMACYDQLYSGGARGATIYVMDGGSSSNPVQACKSTDPTGCGIWVLGASDVNWASPPSGWRKQLGSGFLIFGVGGSCDPAFGRAPQVCVAAGSATTPGISMSGNFTFAFKNLYLNTPGIAIQIGIDSTGNRSANGGASSGLFDNVGAATGGVVGEGPVVDVGSSVFQIVFKSCSFAANYAEKALIAPSAGAVRSSNVVTVTTTATHPFTAGERVSVIGAGDSSFQGTQTVLSSPAPTGTTFAYSQNGPNATSGSGSVYSDKALGISLNPGSGHGDGLIRIEDVFFDGTGVKGYPGDNGVGPLIIDGLGLQESGFGPAVWLVGESNEGMSSIKNVYLADSTVSYPAIFNEYAGAAPGDLTVEGAGISGPATVFGGGAGPIQSAARNGQSGVMSGHLVGQTDAARRGFGPVASRFVNLTPSNPASWPIYNGGGSPTITTGISAPDGTTGAVQATSSGSSASFLEFVNRNQTFAAGDIVMVGAWVRSMATPGAGGGAYCGASTSPLGISITSSTTTYSWSFNQGDAQPGDGEWAWVWLLSKIATASPASGTLIADVSFCANYGVQLYAPTLFYLPSGTVSDNEAFELAGNMQASRSDATAGQVSLLPHAQLKADSIQVGAGSAPVISSGTGAPTGTCISTSGCIYLRLDGGVGSTLYVYENGNWAGK